jgi:hypothetical protein
MRTAPLARTPSRGSANWTEDGVNTPEEIDAEIWRHALEMAEPGGLGRLVETEAVIQALILAAGRLAEHTGMPPALFCGHVVEAIRRLMAERDTAQRAILDVRIALSGKGILPFSNGLLGNPSLPQNRSTAFSKRAVKR